jgi:hypothetical protein
MIENAAMLGDGKIKVTVYLQVAAMVLAGVISLADVNGWPISAAIGPLAPLLVVFTWCAPIFVVTVAFFAKTPWSHVAAATCASVALSAGTLFALLPGVQ